MRRPMRRPEAQQDADHDDHEQEHVVIPLGRPVELSADRGLAPCVVSGLSRRPGGGS
jgi:hypothetical protein